MAEAARDGHVGPPWGARRGFGCLFGLLFLLVAGSLVAGSAFVLSQLGPLPGLIALGFVVLLLAWMGRTLFLTARTLDRLVDATRQVEGGDYSVRVGAIVPDSAVDPVDALRKLREAKKTDSES